MKVNKMPTLEDFTLALRAYQQVQAEMGLKPPGEGEILPNAVEAMQRGGPLAEAAIVFGVANDGLPLLLHTDNPITGPILLLGDRGSGKTAFLQTLARSAHLFSPPEQTAIVTLTDFPDEWWQNSDLPAHNFRVYPAYEEDEAEDLLLRLADWVALNQQDRAILLLIDGLESVFHLSQQSQESLAFLLQQGPAARVWPVVAINAARACKLPDWIAFFRTRLYGRIMHPQVGNELTHLPGAPLDSLFPGTEFCIRHQSRWLRFWLPSF